MNAAALASADGRAAATDRDAYQLAEAYAAARLSPAAVSLLAASVAAREHAAAVQAHRQFFEETVQLHLPAELAACTTVVVANDGRGGAVCVDGPGDADEATAALAPLLAAGAPASATGEGGVLTAMRHDYSAAATAGPDVVLYGELGTAAFARAHARLARLADAGQIRYAVRHRALPPAAGAPPPPVAVAGYGVELAIKSTEYRAIDDSQIAQDAQDAAAAVGTVSEDEDDVLPAHLDSPKTLDLAQLGFKAVKRILNAADPIAMLRHVAQNLPSTAFALAQAKTPSQAFRAGVQAQAEALRVLPGHLWVNGRALSVADVNDLNPYQLLPLLRHEVWVAEELGRAGLTPTEAASFLETRGSGATAAQVFDVRSDAVVFFNDLRTDDRYANFASHLPQILQMHLQYHGQMHFMRHNLVTILFVLDPYDVEQVAALARVQTYLNRAVPLRFAALFLDPSPAMRAALARGADAPDTPEPRSTSNTVLLYRAMAAHRDAGGDAAVRRFLLELGAHVARVGRIDAEVLRDVVAAVRVASWATIAAAADAYGPLDAWATQAHADAARRGMLPSSIFVNGEYLPWESVRRTGRARGARKSALTPSFGFERTRGAIVSPSPGTALSNSSRPRSRRTTGSRS